MLGDWEVPRIAAIRALERRSFVELPVPGRTGSLFQDLNTAPTRLVISGSLHGDEAKDEFLEELRAKFRAGEAVTFVADIVTATELQYVVIDTLHFEERGERPDDLEYLIVLRESPPPPPPPDPFGGLDAGLLDQAAGFLDAVTGALDAINALGNIPDFGDPTKKLRGVLGGVTSALEGLGGAAGALDELFGAGE
jgi:hypothetical protein